MLVPISLLPMRSLEDTTPNPTSFVLEYLHTNLIDLAQRPSARLATFQALLVSCLKALQV